MIEGDGVCLSLFMLDSKTRPLELTLLADEPRCPRAGVPLLVKSLDTKLDDLEVDPISERALPARELTWLLLLEFLFSWDDFSCLFLRDFADLTAERSVVAVDTTESRSSSVGLRPLFCSILDSLLAELRTRLFLLEFLLSSLLVLREFAGLTTERFDDVFDTAEARSPLDDLPPLFCPALDPLMADDLPLAGVDPSGSVLLRIQRLESSLYTRAATISSFSTPLILRSLQIWLHTRSMMDSTEDNSSVGLGVSLVLWALNA